MALYDTPRPLSARRGSFGPGRLLGRAIAALHAWNDARSTRDVLARLSPHELADIGLDHGDIDVVAEGRRRAVAEGRSPARRGRAA